jgi:hypothetical protein
VTNEQQLDEPPADFDTWGDSGKRTQKGAESAARPQAGEVANGGAGVGGGAGGWRAGARSSGDETPPRAQVRASAQERACSLLTSAEVEQKARERRGGGL